MSVTVGEVYGVLDSLAPFALQEEWDNAGLLAGSERQHVSGILCSLDMSPSLIREAVQKGANLIITHHPILFRARKNLCEDDPEGAMLCELVRKRIALIAAHTNYDSAKPGVNDALAAYLSLEDVQSHESGMRIGTPAETTLGAFCEHVQKQLATPVRCYGDKAKGIKRVAVLGGAGGDYLQLAMTCGADVYLTGEISHHRALEAGFANMSVLEAGHAATELPAIHLLRKSLQDASDALKWNICIDESSIEVLA